MYEDIDYCVLNVEDLMLTLKIGKNLAYALLNSGDIPAFKIRRVWKIPRASLDEFIINSARKGYQFLSSSS